MPGMSPGSRNKTARLPTQYSDPSMNPNSTTSHPRIRSTSPFTILQIARACRHFCANSGTFNPNFHDFQHRNSFERLVRAASLSSLVGSRKYKIISEVRQLTDSYHFPISIFHRSTYMISPARHI